MTGGTFFAGVLAFAWLQALDASQWSWANLSSPAIIFAIAAVVLAALCAWFAIFGPIQRKAPIKELSFGITDNKPIVSVDPRFKGDLSILYRGQEVRNLTAALVTFKNTGDLPIEAADFDAPLRIVLGGAKSVFGAYSFRCYPEHLKPNVSIDGSSLIIDPLLLNASEHITVAVVVETTESLTARGEVRVAGLGPLPLLRSGEIPVPNWWRIAVTSIQLIVTLAFLYMVRADRTLHTWGVWALTSLMGIATIYGICREIRAVRAMRHTRWMGARKQLALKGD